MIYEIKGSVFNLGISLANALNPYALLKFEDNSLQITGINAERTTKVVFTTKLDSIEPKTTSFALNVKFVKNLITSLSNKTIRISEEERTERVVLETETDRFKLPKMDAMIVGEQEEVGNRSVNLQLITPSVDLIRILNNFKEIEKTFSFEIEDQKAYVISTTESFDLKSQLELRQPPIVDDFDSELIRFNARLLLPALSILRNFDTRIEIGQLFYGKIESDLGDFVTEIYLAPIQEMEDLPPIEFDDEEFYEDEIIEEVE